jgi:hypothetical protein
MKKVSFIIVFTLISLGVKGQDSATKLKIYAVNVGLGSFHLKKDVNGHDGLAFISDLTVSLDRNLISVAYLGGTSLKILDGPNYNFKEYSLSYGREWKVANWFSFEGFAGFGHFTQTSKDSNIGTDKTVSFPLKVNAKFYFTKKFGMGLNTNYSINSVNNNLSTNLIFHYKFN